MFDRGIGRARHRWARPERGTSKHVTYEKYMGIQDSFVWIDACSMTYSVTIKPLESTSNHNE
jgi:hypothetical protein